MMCLADRRHLTFVHHAKFHDENPKTYKAFYRALVEAAKIINADKNAAAETYIRREIACRWRWYKKLLTTRKSALRSRLNVRVYTPKNSMSWALKNKADSWKDYFFNEAWENPGS
jgi:NitT/TauT family transport system substrate-binding protein